MLRTTAVSSLARWIAFAPTAVAISGCSLIFVSPPKAESSRLAVNQDCTTSKVAPVVDSVLAGLLLTGVLVRMDSGSYRKSNNHAGETDLIVDLASMGLFTGSSVYGFVVTSSCSDAIARAQRAQAREAGERRVRLLPEQNVPTRRTIQPPLQIAGFGFGWTLQQAANTCESTGGKWDATPTKAVCSQMGSTGATDPGELSLEFRNERIKRIKVQREALAENSASFKDAYDQAIAALSLSFGKPDYSVAHVPPDCRSTLAECLQNRRASVSARWLWPNQFEITTSLRPADGKLLMTFDYFYAAPLEPIILPTAPAPVPSPGASPTSQPQPTTAVAEDATLSINSLPGSSVVVDGKPLGAIPVTWHGTAGTHQILVVHPQYGKKTVSVTVKAGQHQDLTVSYP